MEEVSGRELKIIMVGEHAVGKTSIANYYVNGTPSLNNEATVGCAFLTKEIDYNGEKIRINIWDTAGQEAYRYLVPMYYRSANVAIVVMDLTRLETLRSVNYWIEDIKKNVQNDFVMAVCGNKADLERVVELDTATQMTSRLDLPYFETSAVSGLGINQMFEAVIKDYLNTHNAEEHYEAPRKNTDGGCKC